MKKYLILFLLFLYSCSSSSKFDYCFNNDTSKIYCIRNADIPLAIEDTQDSYSSFYRESQVNETKLLIESNMQTVIFLYSSTCRSCEQYFPIINQFEIDTQLEIFYFNLKYGLEKIYTLVSSYPNGNYSSIVSSITTPSMFILNSSLSADKVDLLSYSSAISLEQYFLDKANLTNIYSCETFSGFINIKKDECTLVYILNTNNKFSKTFMDSKLLRFAKFSTKTTIIINWNQLLEIDRNNFKKIFDLDEDFEQLLFISSNMKIIKKFSYISEFESINSYLTEYFN